MNLSRKWRWVIGGVVGLAGLFVAFMFAMAFLNPFHAHKHCIKVTSGDFWAYATDHGGDYPFHTNGFGDALLHMVRSNYTRIAQVTAPGDDGRYFEECLKTGADVPEDKCSRVYVQGLRKTSDSQLALIFDRSPTPGGDHFRRPWGPLMRDVCRVDGSTLFLSEQRWPEFAREQVELLVLEGVSRAEAERLYAPPSPP
jgi:hypothetical protein